MEAVGRQTFLVFENFRRPSTNNIPSSTTVMFTPLVGSEYRRQLANILGLLESSS